MFNLKFNKMKRKVLNALRNLPEGQNVLWLLYETKNLYKYFEEAGVEVDLVAIPDSDDHRLSDTLENLFNTAMTELARVMGVEDSYELYDFLFTEVKIGITPYEEGKSQYWVVKIDDVEHFIYWRN